MNFQKSLSTEEKEMIKKQNLLNEEQQMKVDVLKRSIKVAQSELDALVLEKMVYEIYLQATQSLKTR